MSVKGISFYRPHICQEARCFKDCEYRLERNGEMLYFCEKHFTHFAVDLWVDDELAKRLQPDEENKEEEV